MTGQRPGRGGDLVSCIQHRRWAPTEATRSRRVLADERTANLDETTSAWIKLSARDDGSFTVTNSRTGTTKQYRR